MPKEIARISKLQDLKALPKMSRREPAKPEAKVTLPEGLNGEALFRWAMQGVRPILRVEPPARKPRITVRPQEDPFEEIFITGQWQWVYNLEADHIEAAHPSVSHLILKKL
ncbi:MAG: hypothetical protein HY315_04645, partial [Acidobacteria bacterium]|nr:hypothetical protein [Acidobacteriota bacterium]